MKSGRSENVSRVVEAVLPVPPSPPASNHAPPHTQVKFANDLAANSNSMVGNFISPSRNLSSSVNYTGGGGGVIKRNSVVPPIAAAAAGESKNGEKTSDVDTEQPAAIAASARRKRPSLARSEDGEFVFHSKE